MEFADKVVIITGGATGLGKATAIKLASMGAKVVIGNRNVDKGNAVVDEIKKNGGTAIFHRTDQSKREDAMALVERAVKEFGRLDMAFNNAGGGEVATIDQITEDELDYAFDLNAKGASSSLCIMEMNDRHE